MQKQTLRLRQCLIAVQYYVERHNDTQVHKTHLFLYGMIFYRSFRTSFKSLPFKKTFLDFSIKRRCCQVKQVKN